MSASTNPDPIKDSGASKSKKKKNKKKGGNSGAAKTDETSNGHAEQGKHDVEQDETQDEEEEQSKTAIEPQEEPDDVEDEPQSLSPTGQPNGTNPHSISSAVALGLARSRSQGGLASPPPPTDATARLEALAKERDTLRQEVTELRKSLEGIQGKHDEEVATLQGDLEEANEAKEHVETQYRNLLGRVNTIKSSLGDRLKADAARLEEASATISELEEQNKDLLDNNNSLAEQIAKLREEAESQASEVSILRDRSNLSQQNWVKERDELISKEAAAREDFENAKQAMQDWEALALNERSLHDNLKERMAELGEQLDSLREAHDKAVGERDINSQAVDGLQKALQEIQNERKLERRQLVDKYEADLSGLRKQVQISEEAAAASKTALESTQKELERALPFEKEVKEKNLLIGKLRHEAVTLNEHLTKALRILKKGRPEDNVDRQIVTNYILHFLAIDRSDPKKFEALQLIAALLNWNEEQREQAGLARPGASNTNLRIPLSPFRRTPSTPSLNSALVSDPMLMASSSSNKESLAELWSDFLQREAAEGAGSRRESETSPPPRSETASGLGITEK
ncbi:hypothetical protein BU24DRAFT_389731 [Aaosphaeria arxii CBS 175.79]|uniref:GRIP domain-containing protein n=1 Tax=Aaosphaeria arxii CBS 175.79 TaxID=1450172 RepID=A0A6A5XYL9_9PLEO|nr:uncharacterized protein BU24DRAFT_389731 [Aaosphaeria arxii CBS 175.79]KAF2018066.1 hypothetical protein BU24DRAFT_389731 [Aaosphaeria arxii CBS 175.79]